nr:39S ribosomal protein L1, mitochondrial-like isoform X2 [Microcebus murinus]
MREVSPVLRHHQKHCLSKMVSQPSLYLCCINVQVPNRHFAAATKPAKKTKSAKDKAPAEKKDDIETIKSYSYMEGEPEDDVYLK